MPKTEKTCATNGLLFSEQNELQLASLNGVKVIMHMERPTLAIKMTLTEQIFLEHKGF